MPLQLYKNRIRAKLRSSLIHAGYFSRPGFLILGTQKGGTVALYNYLFQHPNIVPPKKEEIGYFDQENLYARGQTWYHSHFPLPNRLSHNAVTFDATPEYLYNPKAAQRISLYDPNIKLIVLLREPLERAFSAWNMFRNAVRNDREYLHAFLPECDPPLRDWMKSILSSSSFPRFDEVVTDEIEAIRCGNAALYPGYVRRGLYYEQLQRYFQYFDRKQIAIVESSRLKSDVGNVLCEIIRFLGLPECDWNPNDLRSWHVGSYETQMTEGTRALLKEFYEPHNQKLYDLLGRDLGW